MNFGLKQNFGLMFRAKFCIEEAPSTLQRDRQHQARERRQAKWLRQLVPTPEGHRLMNRCRKFFINCCYSQCHVYGPKPLAVAEGQTACKGPQMSGKIFF